MTHRLTLGGCCYVIFLIMPRKRNSFCLNSTKKPVQRRFTSPDPNLFPSPLSLLKLPNMSQITSKCGKNKKVARTAIAECVTDVLTTF